MSRPAKPGAGLRQALLARITGLKAARQASGLALRFIAARAMSILTLLVAAWFFEVTAFGDFGVYLSLVNLAWIALFLRYESAIVATVSEAEAEAALRLSLAIGGLLWALAALAAFASAAAGLASPAICALFLASLGARGLLRLAGMAATRQGDLAALGEVALVQSVLQPLVLLAAAATLREGALCLALADAAGHLGAALYLWRRQFGFLARSLRGSWSTSGLSLTARAWSGLPILNLPGSLIALAFVTSPLLIMPLVANPIFAGQVALAWRIFDVPNQIISAATAPVLMSRLRPSGDGIGAVFGRRFTASAGLLLLAIFGALTLAFALIDPWVQGTIFAGLGEVAPYAAIFQGSLALAGPLAEACSLYRSQGMLTAVHAAALAGSFAALGTASFLGPTSALIVLAAVAIVRTLLIGECLRTLSLRGGARETDASYPP